MVKKTMMINSVRDLPKITSYIFPKEYKLLPNTSELFEIEFAFWGYNPLSKDEYISLIQEVL